jgi:tetratricopeptide (TPR) repeat protein
MTLRCRQTRWVIMKTCNWCAARSLAASLVLVAATILFLSPFARAAQQQPAAPGQPAQPPQPDASSSSSSAATPSAQGATQYNPLPAENDIEVATFYMKKGDPDAAIPRLQEAIQLMPNLAKPRLLLGEIYEKKGDKQTAVKYYREYLQVFPHAPDAKKVQEKIAKLSKS